MKLKRTFSIVLSALMALAVIAVPMMASAVTQNAVIDTTQTGTLTVHKYEMTDISGLNDTDHKGTGEASDSGKVDLATYPEDGAVPLAEVTFTAKKIAEVNSTYYTPSGVELPTPAAAANMNVINSYTATTNASGVATFSNLPLGIYLVQETDAPPQVTQRTADFVVSVPMTAEDGDHWNYNPVVFPKNQTAYAEITINKVDYADSTVGLPGAKFTLQRLHDYGTNTGAWDTIETDITTGADGTVSPTRPLAYNSTYRLIETTAPSLYVLDHAHDTTTFYIDNQGRICSTATGHAVIDSTNPDQITITNTKPTIEKFIDKSKGQGTGLIKSTTVAHTSADDANVYVLRVKTPNVDMNTMSKFTVTDAFGTKSNTRPVVTKVVESGTSTTLPANATGYTATVDSTSPYNVVVDFSTADSTQVKKNTLYDIYIENFTYVLDSTTTNTADLQYTIETGTQRTSAITSDETTIRTGAFEFKKVNPSNAPLAGTEFKLYTTQADAVAGTNPVTAQDGYTNQYTTTFTANSDGKVWIKYLEYGDNIETGSKNYWLVETKSVNGYNLLSAPVQITVNKDSYTYANTQQNIVNTPKTILPRTGGYGILIYGVIGSLVAGAGVWLVLNSRKKKKEQ